MLSSLFCKHDWEFEQQIRVFSAEIDITPHTIRNVYICKKCLKVKRIKL